MVIYSSYVYAPNEFRWNIETKQFAYLFKHYLYESSLPIETVDTWKLVVAQASRGKGNPIKRYSLVKGEKIVHFVHTMQLHDQTTIG